MSNQMKMVFYAFASLFICINAEAKDCVVQPFNATWGLEMPGNMTVVKNKTCATLFNSTGQNEIAVLTSAQHGVVTPLSNGVRYKPNKDYIGPDEFTFMRKGQDRYGSPSESRIKMSVTVVSE